MVITDKSRMGSQSKLSDKVSTRMYSIKLRSNPKWTLAKSNGKSIIRVVNQTMPLEMNNIISIPCSSEFLGAASLRWRLDAHNKSVRKMSGI